jgi:3-deoxy-D-manno-octulosonic-acid transferase
MAGGRLIYNLLLWLALPWLPLRLLWRARRQPEYRRHWAERFGRYRATAARPIIWVHAVSVGETRAALPLIRALRHKYPDHGILLTHMTPTGRAAARDLFSSRVIQCYLPYDYPFAVRRFLEHFKPVVGVLMETELWPNLIGECKQRRIPLYLVNARLSEKSAAGYRRFSTLTGDALRGLAGIAAQSEADAQRLTALGAQDVAVTGNLKFDVEPPAELVSRGGGWRRQWDATSGAARPVLLAASTREGEEELLLDALARLDVPNLLFVIVPRHPQRFDEVAGLIEKHGLKFARRSVDQPVNSDTRVVLGDSMGELFAYYAACDVAFIGGSLLPYGGQNLIEACAAGRPVLVGPHTYNFAEAVKLAVEAGAAVQVEDTGALADQAQRLLRDSERRMAMADAARGFSGAHRGAAGRVVEWRRF